MSDFSDISDDEIPLGRSPGPAVSVSDISDDDFMLGNSPEPQPDECDPEDRIDLDFAAAIRIDNIPQYVGEDDIFDHFRSCGDIRFVVKTGYAAYVQFLTPESVAKAQQLKMIVNGNRYALSRISPDDWVDHIKVIENMKDSPVIENMKNVKYRKPYLMVENYPELPTGTPIYHYKSNFEDVGLVRHFKIAPTSGGTVTLALCMDEEDDRILAIDRFNDNVVSGKLLKLYVASGKARMTVAHVAKYASSETAITVEGIRPYYEDYDVCLLFRKCGSVCFLEKFGSMWVICFDHPSGAFAARNFQKYSIYKKPLIVKEFNRQTFLAENSSHGKTPTAEAAVQLATIFGYLQQIATIKQTLQTAKLVPTKASKKQKKQKNAAAALQNPVGVKVTPEVPQDPSTVQPKTKKQKKKAKKDLANAAASDVPPKPSASQPSKRPANANGSNVVSLTSGPENDPNNRLPKNEFHKLLFTVSNLPKGIEESDLRELLADYPMTSVSLFCSKDLYHPTSVAFIRLANYQNVKSFIHHRKNLYRGKQTWLRHTKSASGECNPDRSIMLKNVPKDITEEGITEELEKIPGLKLLVVIKPAHHYAYVHFADVIIEEKHLNIVRNALTRFKADVYPLYRKIPKQWMSIRSFDIKPIESMRKWCGAVLKDKARYANKEIGLHNAHKLFVGNIPRDTQAEDVIDYFNNFGSVIDYAPIEKKSCYLRKSAILTFVDKRHAQNAYCQQTHYLEGSALDVHLMDGPPMQYEMGPHLNFLTVKFHSRYITNDEIRHALQKIVNIQHSMRFDAFDERANFVAVINYNLKKRGIQRKNLITMQYINDEGVTIVEGCNPFPPTEDEAREKELIGNSQYRQQKLKYLSAVITKEQLKDEMEMRSKPINDGDIPFKSFYNDYTVQINNVSLDTTLEDIRDLFIKCGDIADYRALLLQEDATKICYVTFKIDLAADLACTYNQRMVNRKRILVHLAKETVRVELDRSVLVAGLSSSTTAEQIHDAFSQIGMVKYVQKQSPFSAIVCFKDQPSMLEVVKVTIPNSGSCIISSCHGDHNPRFYNNFCCQEEVIPIERMRAALQPRSLPEFHQLERQLFAALPEDTKTRLINEVFLARKQLPNFNVLPMLQQLEALKTRFAGFTQREQFLRLNAREQEKLLDVTSSLQRDYPYREATGQEVLPPAAKVQKI